MSNRVKTSNCATVNQPVVGGEDFLETLLGYAVEDNWARVLLLAAFGLGQKFETADSHLSEQDLEYLELALKFLLGMHEMAAEKQNNRMGKAIK